LADVLGRKQGVVPFTKVDPAVAARGCHNGRSL
jgi:hypothetical protein